MTRAPSQFSISWRRSFNAGLGIAMARLRFFLLLGLVLAIVAMWPTLRNLWDKLTGPSPPAAGVSADTEYWCSMCPGVVSDWPGKCPVCHMSLMLRKKGEMTPLPDGVVARMQFPPYRVQLAGIHTSQVEFRRLVREVVLSGLLERSASESDSGPLALPANVLECDIGLIKSGQKVDLTTDAFPGRTFPATVIAVAPQVSLKSRSVGVRLEMDGSQPDLRPGMLLAGRLRVPLASLPETQHRARDAWRDRTTLSVSAAALASVLGFAPAVGFNAQVESAIEHAALQHEHLLVIPESAVIDTGARKVVFLEETPGVFDAVQVHLGRRCGDFYPVVAGLAPGQNVVTAGSFLLDAETRLNPAAAAGYFGAASRGGAASATPTAAAPPGLSAEDQLIVKRQKLCPVLGEPLGSMGAPFRIVVQGRTVFLCCEGCATKLRKDPAKFLAKLPK